jgi:uncharacterized coiled-coil DUF342 family protein
MSDLKESLTRDIDALRQLRDELRVQLHLAKAEAKDHWDKLEEKWEQIQAQSLEAGRESVQKLTEGTQKLVSELKREYEELKSTL